MTKEKRDRETMIVEAMKRMRQDTKHSDLTIVCEGKKHAVHKAIVCTQSDFFAKACDGGFMEAFTSTITLQERLELVEAMIDFLYSQEYKSPQPSRGHHNKRRKIMNANGEPSAQTMDEMIADSRAIRDPNIFHVSMYSLADRLIIKGLKTVSMSKLAEELTENFNHSEYLHVIHEIYWSTPASDRGLRDLVVELTIDNLQHLMIGSYSGMKFSESLVKTVPQFTSDLLVAITKEHGSRAKCRQKYEIKR